MCMNWSIAKRNVLVSFILLMLLPAINAAQTGTTSLRGTVVDKSGATVSDAKVTLSDSKQGFERGTASSKSGEYEFQALPPGTYMLTVELQGFRKFEQRNLQLLVNLPATAN